MSDEKEDTIQESSQNQSKRKSRKKKKVKTKSVETTVHVRRYVRNCINHKKAPRTIKVLRFRARKMFKIRRVKIETGLNKIIWADGIKRPPSRIRVKFQKDRVKGKRGTEPCVIISHVPVKSFKGLKTKVVGNK
mmetsp:Transcript_42989/g.52834  ORF Transcript_42989/g.52834 Transcript_42989/m.52834 type:complete len:134 (+) Transcript_42989:78-479(+)